MKEMIFKIICLITIFQSLHGDDYNTPCLKHAKFRYELADFIKEFKLLVPFGFLLADEPNYSLITKSKYARYRSLARRLEDGGDLAINKLNYFYQFNERFQVTSQASAISTEQELFNINYRFTNNRIKYDRAIENINEALNKMAISLQNIENIRNLAILQFLDYYNCPCAKRILPIIHDHGVLALSIGDIDHAIVLCDELIQTASTPPNSLKFLKVQYSLDLGISFNEGLNYSKALEYLSEAIFKDPLNKEAYAERARAFFELSRFDEANADFINIDTSNLFRSSEPSYVEFCLGFLEGTHSGSRDTLLEYPPALLNSLNGINRLFWTCVSEPLAVPQQMIEAINEIIEYAATKNLYEIGEDIAPELYDLVNNWHQYNAITKGTLCGQLLGKYGVDVLACYGSGKALKAFSKLKRINAMCNLESMALSELTKDRILILAETHSLERKYYLDSLKFNYDSHYKHVLGHNDFVPTGSIWTHPHPEKLLKQFAGTGIPYRGEIGFAGFKEVVDFKEVIGMWKTKNEIIALPTTRGTIHYGKKGAHIVPSNPKPAINLAK